MENFRQEFVEVCVLGSCDCKLLGSRDCASRLRQRSDFRTLLLSCSSKSPEQARRKPTDPTSNTWRFQVTQPPLRTACPRVRRMLRAARRPADPAAALPGGRRLPDVPVRQGPSRGGPCSGSSGTWVARRTSRQTFPVKTKKRSGFSPDNSLQSKKPLGTELHYRYR